MDVDPQPRMKDVAERAGTSLSTVSRALRGAPGVAPEVRRRVEEAAHELSYVVSRSASSLVTRRTGRVGLLLPHLDRWFFAAAARAVCDRLQEDHLDPVVYQLGGLSGHHYVRTLPLRQNVDVVVAVSLDFADELAEQLDELNLPTVFCSRRTPDRHCAFIDNVEAARSATRYLLNLGHTDVAYICSQPSSLMTGNFGERARGYTDAMTAAGLPPRFVHASEGVAGGEAGMARLLGEEQVPTAVFAETDEAAFGVRRVLSDSGVAVPEAISVMGFDNHEMSRVLGLTTVDQHVPALGRAAGQIAAELATGATSTTDSTARQVEVDHELVVRSTTGTARESTDLGGAVIAPAADTAKGHV